MSAKARKSKEAINYLQSSKGKILGYMKKIVGSNGFSYRTFGVAIEEHLADAIVKVLAEGGFIKSKADYALSPNKNYFPDFELKTSPPVAIEFKSGNRSQNRNGKWVKVKNSENDMGTLNEWPKRIKRFGGDNIYYIFVIYNFDDRTKEVSSLEIAPFYNFVGVNRDKFLKYREKDGNLRPKDFDAGSPVKTLEQFQKLFSKTIVYRSKRIIKKHRLIIKKASQNS